MGLKPPTGFHGFFWQVPASLVRGKGKGEYDQELLLISEVTAEFATEAIAAQQRSSDSGQSCS